MKRIPENEILRLKQNGKVKAVSGGKLKAVLPFANKKESEAEITPEEQQTKVIKAAGMKLAEVIESNGRNDAMLIDMVRKLIIKPDIKIPAFPVQVKKWNFRVERDKRGFIEEITATAM